MLLITVEQQSVMSGLMLALHLARHSGRQIHTLKTIYVSLFFLRNRSKDFGQLKQVFWPQYDPTMH